MSVDVEPQFAYLPIDLVPLFETLTQTRADNLQHGKSGSPLLIILWHSCMKFITGRFYLMSLMFWSSPYNSSQNSAYSHELAQAA